LRTVYGVFGLVWGLATVVLLLGSVSSFIGTMLTQFATTGGSRMLAFLVWQTALLGLGSLVGGLNAVALLWFAVWGSTSMPRKGSTPRDASRQPALARGVAGSRPK
jgi:hypothetical protein